MYFNIFLNIIILLFPLLIYFIYNCYINLKLKKYNSIFFEICSFSSLYLSLKYISMIDNDKLLLFCNIPIVLSFIKKNNKLAIILSIYLIMFSYTTFNINIILLIIKYLIYYIIYLTYKKKKKNSYYLIEFIAIFQGFFLAFEYNYVDIDYSIIRVFFDVVIFYILTFMGLILIDYADKITSLFIEYKELEKEKKLKDSLFKITHEIKNPIAVCKGYLDMLDIDNKDKVKRYIPIIKEEIERCLCITTDFMEFSKIKIEKDIIDINLLLDEINDSFDILIKSNKIKLDYKRNDEELYVNGDFNRLKQVLLNIIKNSIEAIEGIGKITIISINKNNYIYIEIKENGIGMDKDDLEKIDELFYTTKKNGTGVGVALCKEIINAHEGTIEYDSKLNKGTNVLIKLPILK